MLWSKPVHIDGVLRHGAVNAILRCRFFAGGFRAARKLYNMTFEYGFFDCSGQSHEAQTSALFANTAPVVLDTDTLILQGVYADMRCSSPDAEGIYPLCRLSIRLGCLAGFFDECCSIPGNNLW